MDRRARIALAQTAASAANWGTSSPVVTIGLGDGLDPGVFVFLRFAVAAPQMFIAAAALQCRVLNGDRPGIEHLSTEGATAKPT